MMLTAKPNQLNQVFNVVSVLHQSQVAENSFDPQKCFKKRRCPDWHCYRKTGQAPLFLERVILMVTEGHQTLGHTSLLINRPSM